MTTEQSKDKAIVEKSGWKIMTSAYEAENYFKG